MGILDGFPFFQKRVSAGAFDASGAASTVADALLALSNSLKPVATSGSYSDLTDKPPIPAVYSLPVASSTALGGVKGGGIGVSIATDGTISLIAGTIASPASLTSTAPGQVPLTITAATGQTAHLLDFITPGFAPVGTRTFFDAYGMLNTQGWITITGVYAPNADGSINHLIGPGATAASANVNYNAIGGYSGGMLGISQDVVGPNILMQDNAVRSGHWRVTDIQPTGGCIGTGYAVNDVLTVSGGTLVSGASAATATVTSVNATGQITGLKITSTVDAYGNFTAGATGRYTFAGPPVAQNYAKDNTLGDGTVALTGGTGTGATAFVTMRTLGEQSRQFDCLDYTQNLRLSLSGGGLMQWGAASLMENFHLAPTNLGVDPNDASSLYTAGKLRAKRGLFAPVGSGSQIGAKSLVSVARAMSTTAGATIEIGTLPLVSVAAQYRVTVTTTSGAASYDLGHVWSAGGNTDGGAGFSNTWVAVSASSQIFAAGSATFALDAYQNNIDGGVKLRLRTVATGGAFGTAQVVIEGYGLPDVTTFAPSTVTATGVSAPTAYWPSRAASASVRTLKKLYTPAEGSAMLIDANVPLAIVKPAAALNYLTVRMPASPYDGQKQRVAFTFAINISATFTDVYGNAIVGRAATTVAAGAAYEFVWNNADGKWYVG